MTNKNKYVLGADIGEDEQFRDRSGRLIDDHYAAAAAEDALEYVGRRGRPSLSRSGESPMLRVRLPRELDEAVSEAARDAGTSRSEWVRRTLAAATARKAS
jgi:predicted HicB family RNase H-like nuclease